MLFCSFNSAASNDVEPLNKALSPVHTCNNVEATLSKQQSCLLLRQCCRFGQQCRSNVRLCRKDEISTQNSFDIVAVLATKSNVASTLLPKNGNNVEATFDIVVFDNVASTLLLVWTGLYAHSKRLEEEDIRWWTRRIVARDRTTSRPNTRVTVLIRDHDLNSSHLHTDHFRPLHSCRIIINPKLIVPELFSTSLMEFLQYFSTDIRPT